MELSELKTPPLTKHNHVSWFLAVMTVVGWVFGYIVASGVKDFQYGSQREGVETRIWSRIDAMENRLSNAEQSVADIQGRAPREFPPKDWLEDTFRPLVERVGRLESK